MFAIANGRKALWQWDLNQQLTVAGSCTEVHYLNKGSPSTLTVDVKDGKADIPNILLQRPGRLVVYAYIVDAQDHHTKVCETFGIAPRPKPAEYVYTETEVKTWSNLQSQIGDLGDLATEEKDNLVAAINEAVQSGGGGAWYVTVTPGTNHNATADKTAAEVYAAYKAGKAVYCILLDAIGVAPAVLPLLAAVNVDGYLFYFAGSGAPFVDTAPFTLTVTYTGAWHYFGNDLVAGELVNSISAESTSSEVPSAKCVYDELQKRNLKRATSDTLGGIKADPATADDTQPVRIDDSGKLVTAAGSGSSGEVWEKVCDETTTEDIKEWRYTSEALKVYKKFKFDFTYELNTGDSDRLFLNGRNASAFCVFGAGYSADKFRRITGIIYIDEVKDIVVAEGAVQKNKTAFDENFKGTRMRYEQSDTISQFPIRSIGFRPNTATIVTGAKFRVWGSKQ